MFLHVDAQKKGGKKDAVGAKARLGAIIGIEDNMAAYRVTLGARFGRFPLRKSCVMKGITRSKTLQNGLRKKGAA